MRPPTVGCVTMAKRRPLEWLPVGPNEEIPDCYLCIDYMSTPFLWEACASVGIEHGKSGDQMLRETVEAFHDGGHKAGA